MSVNTQRLKFINWNPSLTEIAELLQNLGISPPQSFDRNLLPTIPIPERNFSNFEDHEKTEFLLHGPKSEETINENYNREAIIEELRAAKEDSRSIKWKNDYLHEYLVEHFKKKQMMHVYTTNEAEDDILLNEYLRKLDELERSNENLRGSREKWDAELTRTCADIREKKETARNAVNEMIEEERTIGASTWYCGKPLSLKRIQTLIARQLDRIRDIAKFRIRYIRLRDEFVTLEVELTKCAKSSPDLTKEDYDRLEAERFCYKRELRIIDERCEVFRKRRDAFVALKGAIKRMIVKMDQTIDHCVAIISDLKNSIKTQLHERKIWLVKLAEVTHFVSEFNAIIGQTERPEFVTRMLKIREEHEEWLGMVSRLLRDIATFGESLNALRAELMLHGNNLKAVANSNPDESPIGKQ